MMKRIVSGVFFSLLSGSLIAGCKTASQTRNALRNENVNQQANAPSNQQIVELLNTFSEDVGPRGREAWRKLQADPELISKLEGLEHQSSPSDKIRPQIAFAFCWLDRDCANKVKVIEAALAKLSPYQGFYADDAQSMLSRLIERGQKDLLKPLFESTIWTDGALTEGLSETFARELQNDPEQFLNQLSTSPADRRQKVYWVIQNSDEFTDEELTVLQKRLSNIPKTSAGYEAARELQGILSSKAPQ